MSADQVPALLSNPQGRHSTSTGPASPRTRQRTPLLSASHEPSATLQVLIPSIPRYVSLRGSQQQFANQLDRSFTKPDDPRNGRIISRYLTEHGSIGFSIETDPSAVVDGNIEKIGVALKNIYNYVTPAELERYEHHEWELEDEREKNRPKVGRPRKLSPYSRMSMAMVQDGIKPKRPLGRPRKHPFNLAAKPSSATQTQKSRRQAFRGIFIASPAKQVEQQSGIRTSPVTMGISTPSAPTSLDKIHMPDTEGDVASRTPSIPIMTNLVSDATPQVDQLTPSNARRVVGAKLPNSPATPSRRTYRHSYSMVQAALGNSASSASEDDVPLSASEDELALISRIPTKSRFAKGLDTAGSVPREVERLGSRQNHRQRLSKSDMLEIPPKIPSPRRERSISSTQDDRTDPAELLQRFGASSSRRIQPASPSPSEASQVGSLSLHIPQLNPIHKYFQPKSRKKKVNATPKQFEQRESLLASRAGSFLDNAQEERVSIPEPSQQSLGASMLKPPSHQTTPTPSKVIRKSMTPHYPPRKKSTTGVNKRRHRVEMARLPAATGTAHDRLKKAPAAIISRSDSTLGHRPQVITALDLGPQRRPACLEDRHIELGSPTTSSEEESVQQWFDAASSAALQSHNPNRPRLSPSTARLKVVLGSPMSSSSDELDRIERPAQPSHVPHQNGNLPDKVPKYQ
ncbi:MAG: hypothetical protein Q9222_000304 [Ikaeria aurantiellina]